MTEPAEAQTLLDEIEARQDEVLARLDELDQRICAVLADQLRLKNRSTDKGPTTEAPTLEMAAKAG